MGREGGMAFLEELQEQMTRSKNKYFIHVKSMLKIIVSRGFLYFYRMVKRLTFLFLLALVGVAGFAQLQSPGQFLGYATGERFTPHWKIVDYFRHVGAHARNIRIEDYGK